jgi:heme/copper-type cytochrome/quinol oxidase subunit 3
MALAVGLLVYILVRTVRAGDPAPADLWDANTLEWTVTSPPALKNFDRVIPVWSSRPYRDYKRALQERHNHNHPPLQASDHENNLMMKLLVGTEAMFFLCLIMAYVYFSYVPGFHGAPAHYLDLRTTGLFSLLLFSSSFTYWRAERNGELGRGSRMRIWLLLTIVLGLVFLLGQVREYAHLLHANVTIGGSLFGTGFFTLTGFHSFHVLVGLVLIFIVTAAGIGQTRRLHISTVRTIGIYWHFVDIVWLFVFLVVYVSPHL